jgi:N-acetylmuramoyl-L-alanine amidase
MRLILDAGHGANTSGKRTPDGSMREFEFNSIVAALVKMNLEKYENVDIRYAHATLRDVPLHERVAAAINFKADCYVSIHANAYGTGWNDASGIETYIAPSRPKEAAVLAEKIQNRLVQYTARKDRGVKTADFYVLKQTPMTAVLVECGFMTNKQEASLLKSDAYREVCARAISDGIIATYGLKKKQASPADNGYYKVQVGAFKSKALAEKLAADMKKMGYGVIIKYE